MRAEPQARPRLDSLDVARGFAANMVVVYHAAGFLALPAYDADSLGLFSVLAFGEAGIDFFFVLSGFVIAWRHWYDQGQPHALAAFVVSRVGRIYPAYWVVLLLVVIGHASLDAVAESTRPDGQAILFGALLLPVPGSQIVPVAWTLCHEVMFYALCALVILNRALGLVVLFAWFGLVAATAIVDARPAYPFDFIASFRNLEFAVGIATAWLFMRRPLPVSLAWLATGVGMVLFAIAAISVDLSGQMSGRLEQAGFALGAAMMLYGLASLDAMQRLRWPTVFKTLGAASYCIYLIHYPVELVILKLISGHGLLEIWPEGLVFAVMSCAGIAAGLLLHAAVDAPAQNWLRRQRRRGRKGSVAE